MPEKRLHNRSNGEDWRVTGHIVHIYGHQEWYRGSEEAHPPTYSRPRTLRYEKPRLCASPFVGVSFAKPAGSMLCAIYRKIFMGFGSDIYAVQADAGRQNIRQLYTHRTPPDFARRRSPPAPPLSTITVASRMSYWLRAMANWGGTWSSTPEKSTPAFFLFGPRTVQRLVSKLKLPEVRNKCDGSKRYMHRSKVLFSFTFPSIMKWHIQILPFEHWQSTT